MNDDYVQQLQIARGNKFREVIERRIDFEIRTFLLEYEKLSKCLNPFNSWLRSLRHFDRYFVAVFIII